MLHDSQIVCNVGNPVFVPRRASEQEFEKIRKDLEDFMVKQVHDLDAQFGIKPVEQDLNATEFKQKKREEAQQRKLEKKQKKGR